MGINLYIEVDKPICILAWCNDGCEVIDRCDAAANDGMGILHFDIWRPDQRMATVHGRIGFDVHSDCDSRTCISIRAKSPVITAPWANSRLWNECSKHNGDRLLAVRI